MLLELFLYVQMLHLVFLKGQYLETCSVLINVNDMSGLIDSTILLYADHSAMLAVDKDISTVQNLLQTDHQIVSE